MLDSKGHIILIDYGLSKQEVSNPTGAMSLVGTPDYSAPEVLRTGVFRSVALLPSLLSTLSGSQTLSGSRMRTAYEKERSQRCPRKRRASTGL
jgi:serine/threonine protein kinase